MICSLIVASSRGENTGCLNAILNSIGTIIITIIVFWVFYEIITKSGDNLFLRIILLACVTILCYWLKNKFE